MALGCEYRISPAQADQRSGVILLGHIVAEEYQNAYRMMDPITRRGITLAEFEKGVEVLNATFGPLKKYTPERHEFIGYQLPGLDDPVPAIDFVYQGQMGLKGRAAAVAVTMTLIEKRAYVSFYDIQSTAYDMLR